jgi:hypothetical protein
VGNVSKSLDRAVNTNSLLGEIKVPSSLREAQKLAGYSELYFWDLGIRANEYVATGDYVYIATKTALYHGQVVTQLDDPSGGIGDAIGWAKQFKKPWTQPIALRNVTRIAMDEIVDSAIQDMILSGQELLSNTFYKVRKALDIRALKKRSFRSEMSALIGHLSGQELESLLSQLESQDAAEGRVQEPREHYGSDTQVQVAESLLSDKFEELIDRISMLKNSDHHSERDHESIVERFFVLLGYDHVRDIKYRVGHVDILINSDSDSGFVVEVKRDWGLSRKNSDVVDQAYRYATNLGKRFVVITNGDYYAFFDRLKGLSISDNFILELHLSELTRSTESKLVAFEKQSLEGG